MKSIFSLFGHKRHDVSKYAFVDVEVGIKDHKIHDIGALRFDDATYHGTSKQELEEFLKERKVDFVCGHNIIHHDAKYLFDNQHPLQMVIPLTDYQLMNISKTTHHTTSLKRLYYNYLTRIST